MPRFRVFPIVPSDQPIPAEFGATDYHDGFIARDWDEAQRLAWSATRWPGVKYVEVKAWRIAR